MSDSLTKLFILHNVSDNLTQLLFNTICWTISHIYLSDSLTQLLIYTNCQTISHNYYLTQFWLSYTFDDIHSPYFAIGGRLPMSMSCLVLCTPCRLSFVMWTSSVFSFSCDFFTLFTDFALGAVNRTRNVIHWNIYFS